MANPYIWATGAKLTLCKVAWDDNYRDVVRFDDAQAQEDYFSGLASDSVVIEHMSYLKPNEPITINLPFNSAYQYNYCVVENPVMADIPGEGEPRKFYYFIEGASMVAPNTTALNVALDCFQTYLFDFEFGRCFVERGHYPFAKAAWMVENRIDTSGGNYHAADVLQRYCTAPEGLDVGSEYINGYTHFIDLSEKYWAIIIQSNVDLAADWGTLANPNLKTADGQMTDGIASGCNVYAIDSWNYKNFMGKVRECPWVAKGIVSITAFPKTILTSGPEVKLGGMTAHFLGDTPDEGIYYTDNMEWLRRMRFAIPVNMDVTSGGKYRHCVKLATSPYSLIQMENFSGGTCELKPELMYDNTLNIKQMACAAPPYIRVGFYPRAYGMYEYGDSMIEGSEYTYHTMDFEGENYKAKTGHVTRGAWVDAAIWFDSFPTMSIVNDEYASYMASTAHSRQFQQQSAGWTLSKSQANNALALNQNQQQLATNQQNQNISNVATVANGALSAIGSLASGNVGGAIAGAAGTGINLAASNMQFQNNQALSAQFAQQNYEMGQWAAQGDYQQSINGILATVQDAQLTQPSVSGQAGGSGFNLSNGLMGFRIIFKTMQPKATRSVGDYFLRYGYAFGEFIQPPKDLKCMTNFSYWKMKETYLICSNADEGVKNVIRGIFEKGVTVWNDPNKIGNIGLGDNDPVEID